MDKKEKILAQAEDMFLQYGIKSVTMDDIARHLGMSKKTLYQYVENKNDLLAQVMVQSIEKHKQELVEIRKVATNAIDEMLRIAKVVTKDLRRMKPTVMYDLQKYYKDIWNLMENLHQEHIYQCIKENIEMGVKQGIYREDLDVDIIAKLFVGKTLIVVDETLFPLRDYNREDLFNTYIKYHLHGIVSDQGLKLLQQQNKI